jgi:tartrate dehydrogenase/decarboxylase/D-malate dehydrogenase
MCAARRAIAVVRCIAGDGIGKEVMPEGPARAGRGGRAMFGFRWNPMSRTHHRLGQLRLLRAARPDDAGRLEGPAQGMDAIFFGAVGWPATVPDHISLWGSLLKFRREFDQYINLRPARLFEGVPCPLAGRKPGDIDYLSCARTPRASTRRSAASCTRARTARSSSRSRCFTATAPSAC